MNLIKLKTKEEINKIAEKLNEEEDKSDGNKKDE